MYVLVLTSCNKNPHTVLASAPELEVVQAKMHELYPDTTPFVDYVPCEEFDLEFLDEFDDDDLKMVDGVQCFREPLCPFEQPSGCILVEAHTLNEFTKEMADPLCHFNLGCRATATILDCSKLYDEATGLFDWNTFHRTLHVW